MVVTYLLLNRTGKTPVLWLKEMIMSGRLGNLVSASVSVWWSRDQAYYDASDWRGSLALDGGVFANQASHHLIRFCG